MKHKIYILSLVWQLQFQQLCEHCFYSYHHNPHNNKKAWFFGIITKKSQKVCQKNINICTHSKIFSNVLSFPSNASTASKATKVHDTTSRENILHNIKQHWLSPHILSIFWSLLPSTLFLLQSIIFTNWYWLLNFIPCPFPLRCLLHIPFYIYGKKFLCFISTLHLRVELADDDFDIFLIVNTFSHATCLFFVWWLNSKFWPKHNYIGCFSKCLCNSDWVCPFFPLWE